MRFLTNPDGGNNDCRDAKRSHLLLAAVGMAILAWVIVRAGPATVMQQLKALRIALPIVIVLSLARLALQTFSWSAALKSEGIDVPAPRLVGVRLASQGMGYLTVFGPVLSEPMKINLLGTPVASTATATFLDNGVYWFTSALIGLAGCLYIGAMRAQAGTSALLLSVIFALLMVFMASRRSLLTGVAGALGKRSPSWLQKAGKVESTIREIRAKNPRLVGRMFWLSMGCQLLLIAEVAAVLWSLRLPLQAMTVIGIECLTRVVKMATGWVPARLGADEGGAMSAFAASGLVPAFGLTLAFTRRARDLCWALAGITWLAWRSRSAKANEIEDRTLFDEGILPCKSLS